MDEFNLEDCANYFFFYENIFLCGAQYWRQIPKGIKIMEHMNESPLWLDVLLFGYIFYSENRFNKKVYVFYFVLWYKKVIWLWFSLLQ